MTTDVQARAVLEQVRPGMSRPWYQGVAAVARFESHYGDAYPGHRNWGTVQCGQQDPCDLSRCFFHVDKHANGEEYQHCLRHYETQEAGAAHLVKVLVDQRPAVAEALETGDATAIAEAMRASGYFEAPAELYAQGLERNAAAIALALEEPLAVARGGGLVGPAPSSSSPSSAPSGGAVVALLLAGLAVRAYASRRAAA